jgi:hypothetical protein
MIFIRSPHATPPTFGVLMFDSGIPVQLVVDTCVPIRLTEPVAVGFLLSYYRGPPRLSSSYRNDGSKKRPVKSKAIARARSVITAHPASGYPPHQPVGPFGVSPWKTRH